MGQEVKKMVMAARTTDHKEVARAFIEKRQPFSVESRPAIEPTWRRSTGRILRKTKRVLAKTVTFGRAAANSTGVS
jgi:hypothetical protein